MRQLPDFAFISFLPKYQLGVCVCVSPADATGTWQSSLMAFLREEGFLGQGKQKECRIPLDEKKEKEG